MQPESDDFLTSSCLLQMPFNTYFEIMLNFTSFCSGKGYLLYNIIKN